LTAVRLLAEIRAVGYAGGYTQVKEHVRLEVRFQAIAESWLDTLCNREVAEVRSFLVVFGGRPGFVIGVTSKSLPSLRREVARIHLATSLDSTTTTTGS